MMATPHGASSALDGSSRGGVLEGVVVVELAQTLAGEFAGGLLSDMGATATTNQANWATRRGSVDYRTYVRLPSQRMSVVCYRVDDWRFRQIEDGVGVTIWTRTLGPRNTNIAAILSQLPAQVRLAGSQSGVGPWGSRYVVERVPQSEVGALLEAHRSPIVTSVTDCDISVCLDFHQHPSEADEGEWVKTPTGTLVYEAKYQESDDARGQLVVMACAFVMAHPVFSRAQAAVAIPRSTPGAPLGLPDSVAAAATARFAFNDGASLFRVNQPHFEQKNLPSGVDPDGNQRDTMRATGVDGRDVIVIDDLLQEGSSLREATRALRAAGASSVVSLCLVKERSGTRSYAFDAD